MKSNTQMSEAQAETLVKERIQCDGCSARALFELKFKFGTLYMCGHHWMKSSDKANKYSDLILVEIGEK